MRFQQKPCAGAYLFGFNGQEKINEMSGVGNHNAAEFWEYDTRLGRRWNVDPVVKSWRSSYDAFDNSPIWKIDPNGDDDYFNKKGKLIGSDGIGTAIRVMDNNAIQSVSAFKLAKTVGKFPMIKEMGASTLKMMRNNSRLITFKNEGETFKSMRLGAEKDDRERGAYIIFDAKNAEVRTTSIVIGEKGSDEVSLPFQTGSNVFSKEDYEITILGKIHTHQQERKYRKMGFSDKDLFESQYRKDIPGADGNNAKSDKENSYTIGADNVNYYSPEGNGKSSNNAGSNKDLESGKYNIGKEALENYGKQP